MLRTRAYNLKPVLLLQTMLIQMQTLKLFLFQNVRLIQNDGELGTS